MTKQTIYKTMVLIVVFVALVVVVNCGLSTQSTEKSGESRTDAEKTYGENLAGALNKAHTMADNAKVAAIRTALESYFAENSSYPASLSDLVPTYMNSEADLKDEWGTVYQLEQDETNQNVIVSAGPDTVFGNEDDIKRRL